MLKYSISGVPTIDQSCKECAAKVAVTQLYMASETFSSFPFSAATTLVFPLVAFQSHSEFDLKFRNTPRQTQVLCCPLFIFLRSSVKTEVYYGTALERCKLHVL